MDRGRFVIRHYETDNGTRWWWIYCDKNGNTVCQSPMLKSAWLCRKGIHAVQHGTLIMREK